MSRGSDNRLRRSLAPLAQRPVLERWDRWWKGGQREELGGDIRKNININRFQEVHWFLVSTLTVAFSRSTGVFLNSTLNSSEGEKATC